MCADLSSTLDLPLKDTAPTLASEVDRPSIFSGVVLVGSSAFDTLSYRPLGVVVRRLEVEEGGEGGGVVDRMVWRWLEICRASRSILDLLQVCVL